MTAREQQVVARAVARFRAAWKSRRLPAPAVGLVLGSGWKAAAERIVAAKEIDPTRIPGFPKPSVKGHSARVVAGKLGGVDVAAFTGRIHAYEGIPLPIVGLTARFLCAIGVRSLVLTNAAGALHADWAVGDAMLIRDHLNLLGGSPLEGIRDGSFGSRFADMAGVWPAGKRVLAARAAGSGIYVREGVYAACRGPQYETPAEIQMLRTLGADAVGMSTVPEAIVAAQMGVPCLGISLVTNHAAGVGKKPLTHDEVLEAGEQAGGTLADWLERAVPLLAREDDPQRRRAGARPS